MARTHDSFTNWMTSNFEGSELEDIAQHGASAGFSGISYYYETSALYDEYKYDIWEWLSEDAESFGYDTPMQLISTFAGARDVHDDVTFKNLLVWYAAERVAAQYVTTIEADDED